ncbi:dihydroxyacetone kinase family protein [Williamsia sterculiae]|uniref:Homodimeric dihydroxyacetone kinase n=1 Tax=Williamsia sterculiae TaxID=1344003 RepID=A0A1N7FSY6_9NOCA|nr:dihydroxyacetone kinase family protein [Williamsia sterculiae]SIS03365.1 homodimeric dihydroxyacetone kinase [Williamsia sterculiae]
MGTDPTRAAGPTDTFLRNDAQSFLSDAVRGLVAANPDIVWRRDPGFLIRRTPLPDGRVALVSGGGSGHEPLHSGFIGDGMLTAVCPGLVFTSPNALQIAAATRAADTGAGVLHIVKNYTGDVMNFRVARRLVADEGIRTATVLVADDVATESDTGPGRRGTGATVVVEKICGAAADRGDSLDDVAALGQRIADGARSMAVATAAPTAPGAHRPSFDLAIGEMEVGIGIHGEPGLDRVPRRDATDTVADLLDRIVTSLGLRAGERVIVVVNGLGAAHPLELNLVFGEVAANLEHRGVRVDRCLVGTLVTALDMSGVSITVARSDDEVSELWDAPTTAPGWPRTAVGVGALVDGTIAEPDDSADTGAVCPWVTRFVERVRDSVEELTDLDRRAGDGDFGTNLAAALGHFAVPLRGSDHDVLHALSTSFLVRAGGTSGAVFGILFRELARAAGQSGDRTEYLRPGAARALAEIVELGGARVGDNTVVDALSPAVDALDDHLDLAAAADAATRGADSTRDRAAGKGRASYLGDATRGVVDPGALVIAWLFAAAADTP